MTERVYKQHPPYERFDWDAGLSKRNEEKRLEKERVDKQQEERRLRSERLEEQQNKELKRKGRVSGED